MTQRTFGWIQNPSSIENLRNTVGIFVYGSKIHDELIHQKIPFLIEYNLAADSQNLLEWAKQLDSRYIVLPYDALKGKGAGKEGRKKQNAAAWYRQ